MPNPQGDLEKALEATNTSFHVRLISTFDPGLDWAPAAADAREWLRAKNPDFDQFPVRDEGAAVGVLIRSKNLRKGIVRDLMQPLSESLIVSADMPIAELIPQLRQHHFRLVLRGSRIDGLVTQSDLLKLPVRMLLFALLNHLEILLRLCAAEKVAWPGWLDDLRSERRTKIKKQVEELKSNRLEPDPLELTDLADVVRILERESPAALVDVAKADGIRKLRNAVAHAKTYVQSPADVAEFVDRFEHLRVWIAHTTEMLNQANG